MGVQAEVESVVSRVPVWGWLALGAGVFVLVASKHNKTAAQIVDPNQPTIPINTPDGGSDPGTTPAPVTPGTTPDPNNGGITGIPPALYSQKLTDIWGGTLDHLIASMTNQPDYVNLQLPGGGSFTTSNGIATAGGGNGTPLINQATIDAEIAHDAQYYQTLRDFNAGNVSAYQSWLDYLRGIGISWTGNPTTPQTLPGLRPTPTLANGDVAGIAAQCNRGDTQCAQRIAPWYRGEPVPGWN